MGYDCGEAGAAKCVLQHYFQHTQASRDYKLISKLSSWALEEQEATLKQGAHQWPIQDGCVGNTRGADECRDRR